MTEQWNIINIGKNIFQQIYILKMTASYSEMLLRTELHHHHRWMMNWPEMFQIQPVSYINMLFLDGLCKPRNINVQFKNNF